MGIRTEAWWVCNKCNKKICKPKKGRLYKLMTEHRKICDPIAGAGIKQVKQGEEPNTSERG